jgi:formate--tetrahydrofolate ligase
MDVKCRYSGLTPDCVVIVATIRALKMHGGTARVVAGKPLPKELVEENLPWLREGCRNLAKQIENMKNFGVPVVVAVNAFATDTRKEVELCKQLAIEAGAEDAVVSTHWADGGKGAMKLAEAVVRACEMPSNFKFLYPLNASIKQKIETIAKKIYNAKEVTYAPAAEKKIKLYTELGFDKLPICMAKTHLSISHDPAMKNVPADYTFPVRDIRASVGAGFLYPLCGDMRTMPGLPSVPAGERVDLDKNGKILGLF